MGISLGESGVLELSVSIFNEAAELVLLIEKNEWITGDPTPWDLDADYQFLRLRAKKYDLLLELDASKQPIRPRAKLRCRGVKIDCQPMRILVNGGPMKGTAMSGNRLQGHCLTISSHSAAGGIVPRNLYSADPLFGSRL